MSTQAFKELLAFKEFLIKKIFVSQNILYSCKLRGVLYIKQNTIESTACIYVMRLSNSDMVIIYRNNDGTNLNFNLMQKIFQVQIHFE